MGWIVCSVFLIAVALMVRRRNRIRQMVRESSNRNNPPPVSMQIDKHMVRLNFTTPHDEIKGLYNELKAWQGVEIISQSRYHINLTINVGFNTREIGEDICRYLNQIGVITEIM